MAAKLLGRADDQPSMIGEARRFCAIRSFPRLWKDGPGLWKDGSTRQAPAMASARGIAIILVVLYHADVNLTARLPTYRPFLAVVDALRYVTVPLFLLCFGLALSGKAGSARRLFAEAVNYLYVYLVWVAISLVLSAFVAQANLPVPGGVRSLVKVLVLPQGPLWFPYGLFVLLLSAALLVRRGRLARLTVGFAAGFIPIVLGHDKVAVVMISTNAVFFYVGLLCRQEIFGLFKRDPRLTCLLTGISYVSLLVASERVGLASFPLIYTVLGLLGFAALVSFWMLQPVSMLSRVLARFGRAALPILVLHDFWNHVAERLLVLCPLSDLRGGAEIALPVLAGTFGLLASYGTFRVIGGIKGFFVAPSMVPMAGVMMAGRAYRLAFPPRKRLASSSN